MTPRERYLARLMFRVRVLEANGSVFENLFVQVMSFSRPGFLRIQPYGNQVDRGNDGYEKEHGRYFQIFSPVVPAASIKRAIDKAVKDFKDKLIPYWEQICAVKEYYFAFNDKYSGTTIDIEKALNGLKQTYVQPPLVYC